MKTRVLITGCSRGIGHALSEEFAKNGWLVCATARRPQSPLLTGLTRHFPDVSVKKLDVLDETSIAIAAAEIEQEWGGVDILINNAALFPGDGNESIETLDPEWFNQAFDSNVSGVVRTVKAFLPLLRKGDGAKIINISSGAGSISTKDDFAYYPYSTSKAALNMLTRALAAELKPQGITVAALSPGWVKTEMGGENAPLSPQQSAESLFRTITSLSLEKTGSFLGRDGEKYEW